MCFSSCPRSKKTRLQNMLMHISLVFQSVYELVWVYAFSISHTVMCRSLAVKAFQWPIRSHTIWSMKKKYEMCFCAFEVQTLCLERRKIPLHSCFSIKWLSLWFCRIRKCYRKKTGLTALIHLYEMWCVWIYLNRYLATVITLFILSMYSYMANGHKAASTENYQNQICFVCWCFGTRRRNWLQNQLNYMIC